MEMERRYNVGMQNIYRRLLFGLMMIITTPIAMIGFAIFMIWIAVDWLIYDLCGARRKDAHNSR